MRRLSRETVCERIYLALTTFRPMFVRKNLGFDAERDRRTLADAMVDRVMGAPDSEAVVLVPDMVGDAHTVRYGRWDEDEPRPCPDVPLASS